ncbi:hypothetical protein [Candidatus Nitrosocosmicus franklandus]|nr:hypothetical protein [Candidatus Nitrosocosmicus franklandus]
MYTDSDLILVDPEHRRSRIIDFILHNQGCSKSKVVAHATENGYASKVSVYEVLNDLKREKILSIRREKPNSKSHQLFIDRKNHVIILTKQLQEIDRLLKALLEKTFSIYNKPVKEWPKIYDRESSSSQLSEIVNSLQYIISFIDHAFKYLYSLEWPRFDSVYRNQMYTLFFTELGRWHNLVNNNISRLIQNYKNQIDDWIYPPQRYEYRHPKSISADELYLSMLQPLFRIHRLEVIFERHGMLNEYTRLIDYLFNMNISQIDSVYPELHDLFFEFLTKNTSYLPKYRERFKREYKEYLVKNGLDD